MRRGERTLAATAAMGLLGVVTAMTGCWSPAPKYQRPSVPLAGAYKELSAQNVGTTVGWKPAQPSDVLPGKWWEVFHDPVLNQLEEQVNVSNQNIAASYAAYLQARALVKQARAQYFPTVSVAPSVSGGTQLSVPGTPAGAIYTAPLDASWAPDLSGRVRSTVMQNLAAAQASAANLANERLLEQATLAVDYYELRSQDALIQLYDKTLAAYRESVALTQALYETGIDAEQSLVQAQTQLETTQAQDTGLGIARAQYEHAIALLVGKPASAFSIAAQPWQEEPPEIPFGLPSALLERRPDIAAAERAVAQANAQIGIGRAAFFPSLSLSASGGFYNTSLAHLFSVPSLFWSLGATLAETIFDGGLRQATVEQYWGIYAQMVATYRQTVLTAFQQVEDALAGLRILAVEIKQQDIAVKASERNLSIAIDRYKTGLDPYLNVITAQTTLLTNQQTAVNLRMSQMVTSVQLIQALGGGWDTAQLPRGNEVLGDPKRRKQEN